MIFLLTILLILVVLFGLLVNQVTDFKNTSLKFILGFFCINQILLSSLTANELVMFHSYSILTWLVFSGLMIFLIWYVFNFIYQNKKQINKGVIISTLKESLLFSPLLISAFILLFIRTNFMDTTAYMNVSAYFQNNIYGMTAPGDLSASYKNVAQFFVYGVYGNHNILYSYFNTLTYQVIGSLIVYGICFQNQKFTQNKYWYLILISAWICSSYGVLFLISAGNLIYQSLVLVLVLYFIRNEDWFGILLSCGFLQFFSMTGSVLTVCVLFLCLVYVLLYKKIEIIFYLIFITLVLVNPLLNILLTTKLLANILNQNTKITILVLNYLICFSGLILVINYHTKKYFFRFDFLQKHIVAKSVYENYKVNFIISLISVAIIIGNFVYVLLFKSEFYINEQVIATLLIMLGLTAYNLFFIKKSKDNNEVFKISENYIILVLGCLTTLLLLPIVSKIFVGNLSIWRIIFITPLMGNGSDIFLLVIFILSYCLNKKFNTNIDHTKYIQSNVLKSSISLFMVSSLIIAPFLTWNTKAGNEIYMTHNVNYNLKYFSYNDISILKNLDIKKETNFFSSTRTLSVVGMGHNISGDIIGKSSWRLSSYGLVNYYDFQHGKNKLSANQKMDWIFDRFKNNQVVASMKYVILNSNEQYFANLVLKNYQQWQFENTTPKNADNLIILKNKNVSLG